MAVLSSKMEGDKLVITIDCSEAARKTAKPSSSGKTLLLATTGGFTIGGDHGVKVSLNATLPN